MAKIMKAKKISSIALQTRKRKGHVSHKAERGTGLKFSLEIFATIKSFSPGTRIKYGPNPKRPGSKSYDRYNGYMKAKTVGEALKLGSKVEDLCWELNRQDYKIVGSTRSEQEEIKSIGQKWFDKAKQMLASRCGPIGLQTRDINDPRAQEMLAKEEAWRKKRVAKCEKLAKELGLPVESPEEIDAINGECTDLRLQRRVADKIAEKKLDSGKKITDQDATEVLELWGFCQNSGRLNVLPNGLKYVYSDTLGAIRRRTGSYGKTPATVRYPNFPRLLNKWLEDNPVKLPTGAKFIWTAINVNANYAAARHRDQNNEGLSVIRAFGSFTGGKLKYWPKDKKVAGRCKVEDLAKTDAVSLDLKKSTAVFDGNRAHQVDDFDGDRYSIVFFTSSGWHKMAAAESKKMAKLGFKWPNKDTMAKFKKATAAA
eukprot:TRINITY_DN4312_c0_g1_i1.p1 TRINITY_DN4312_c0_g1~~TRINITY_DN4312_c0_g1_i1.p1  ORF type:complete len:427 (-),score=148.23 TRINITY_DN4312_c0_g1_i1:348-1628(-)